ncbi:MAG: RimK/LysX family protein [Pirellulales bacterium]|nr:RimK/LysX family protein [Pirellulales bacterium]
MAILARPLPTDDSPAASRRSPLRWAIWGVVLALAVAVYAVRQMPILIGDRPVRVLGATEVVEQVDEQLSFTARVDTGANTCSVHASEWSIQDEAEAMVDNVGKIIRFCIDNGEGGIRWVERQIVELATVKTSVGEEPRYKVYMTLRCQGVEKRVLVSLNDRSQMQYPLLIGRNFLAGDFLVDVGW